MYKIQTYIGLLTNGCCYFTYTQHSSLIDTMSSGHNMSIKKIKSKANKNTLLSTPVPIQSF